jgi:hypothetical protein
VKNSTIAAIFGAAATTLTIALGSAPAHAIDLSFTGKLDNPNDTQSFFFTVSENSIVNLRSYSYAGGKNAAGTEIAPGGFDPILSLFDGDDKLIESLDDGPDLVPADPVTGFRYDTNFSESLIAGKYRFVISQFANFANGPTFSDGFPTGNTDFGGRTSFWAVDVLGIDAKPTTAVPEPSDLIGTVVAGFAVIGLKRKLASGKQAKLKISR